MWQERGAHEAARKPAKNAPKSKEQERATFFSPSEHRCLPASTLKPEEREFVVDSGASMHMISEEDLSDAEMDILKKLCSPTIVITANGEVQTHEEAAVYVKELDIFNGQRPHLIKNGIRIQGKHGELRSYCSSRLVSKFVFRI